MTYTEEKYGYSCVIKIGGVKGKPSDYFSGEIYQKDKLVSKVSGSYLSHIDFDGKRYWDIRENYPIKFIETDRRLPSSSLNRLDRKLLAEEKIVEAQKAKDDLENIQRNDRKLREKYAKNKK